MTSLLYTLGVIETQNGMTLEGLKGVAKGAKPHLNFILKPYEGGYALWYDLERTFGHSVSGWYLAERSRKVRRFRTFEAAISVARELGLTELRIEVFSPAENVIRL